MKAQKAGCQLVRMLRLDLAHLAHAAGGKARIEIAQTAGGFGEESVNLAESLWECCTWGYFIGCEVFSNFERFTAEE